MYAFKFTFCITIILVLFHLGTAARDIYYVSPNASIDSCPTQPCLSLDQYTRDHSEYFTTGSVFTFLPGNHNLTASLNLTDVSNIAFKSAVNDTHPVIMCTVTVHIVSVNDITFTGLTFLLQLAKDHPDPSTALVFCDSDEVVITDSVFQNGNGLFSERGAIFSSGSNLTISNSHFEGNTGHCGGAINTSTSTIILKENTLYNNSAMTDGGAIYLYRCIQS